MRHKEDGASNATGLLKMVPNAVGVLLLIGLLAGAVFGAEKQAQSPAQQSRVPSLAMRVGELVGRNVENEQGEIIAEIDGLVIDEKGCIRDVVLSIGELFGIPDKLVAVPFDSLKFREEWKYRIRYKADGTRQRIPWMRQWNVIYAGEVQALQTKPDYHYDYVNPRGSVTGWGIYSYPLEKATE